MFHFALLIDPRNISEPLHRTTIDLNSGPLMPFYDNDVQILYLAGKGDRNIRYYSVMEDLVFLSSYSTVTHCVGMAMKPKIGCDCLSVEISCLIKGCISGGVHSIQPIHFYVPRRNDNFQEDIFVDTPAIYPSSTADSWMKGNNHPPIKVSLPFKGENRFKSARK